MDRIQEQDKLDNWWNEVFLRTGLDETFRNDFTITRARLMEAIEIRDGIGDLVGKCREWMRSEPDFEGNPFKTAMALSFLRSCEGILQNLSLKMNDIEAESKKLLARLRSGAAGAVEGKTKGDPGSGAIASAGIQDPGVKEEVHHG